MERRGSPGTRGSQRNEETALAARRVTRYPSILQSHLFYSRHTLLLSATQRLFDFHCTLPRPPRPITVAPPAPIKGFDHSHSQLARDSEPLGPPDPFLGFVSSTVPRTLGLPRERTPTNPHPRVEPDEPPQTSRLGHEPRSQMTSPTKSDLSEARDWRFPGPLLGNLSICGLEDGQCQMVKA